MVISYNIGYTDISSGTSIILNEIPEILFIDNFRIFKDMLRDKKALAPIINDAKSRGLRPEGLFIGLNIVKDDEYDNEYIWNWTFKVFLSNIRGFLNILKQEEKNEKVV